MLYLIYELLTSWDVDVPGATVLKFISFRTAWGVITALVFAYFLFPPLIRWLQKQRVEQIIRSDGPESHLLNKVGTPTMGGVCILAGVVVATLLWARLDNALVWMVLVVMIGYAGIGFVDDWRKVMYRSAAGLRGRYKIVLQVLIGGGVLAYGYLSGVVAPTVAVPFVKNFAIDFAELWPGAPDALGWLYPAFALFILISMSNAVNLTDGLDGLAIGPTMTCAATYGLIAYVAGHKGFADFLGIPFVAIVDHTASGEAYVVTTSGEVAVLAMALVGAGLGFLWYNSYPAQIFMGDTGSLALGGALGMLGVVTKHELLLALVGGVFVLEAASVVIQVASFKTTGKRVFAMAPIHHHYEKKGWSEPKIIVRFWIISIVLALVALSTLKLR